MQYRAVKLVARPELTITPDLFELVTLHTRPLRDREILLKQTHMSLDPAMRGWMSDDTASYIPPVELGDIMRSSGLADVVESMTPEFPVGSRVIGMIGWTEYAVSQGEGLQIVPAEIPADAVLAVLSAPGLTACKGLEIAAPKAGETLVVSGAAGSVGSMVGQMAKADGLRVVGTAGSNEKCRWLETELGFDKAINYKTASLAPALEAATPEGVDIYFENTGGPVQSAVFERMNAHGRIIVCGMIADYNTETPAPGPNWLNIVRKRLTIRGFTLPDHQQEFPVMLERVATLFMTGQLKYRTHTLQGLQSAIEGINLLFTGGNEGKLMVEL